MADDQLQFGQQDEPRTVPWVAIGIGAGLVVLAVAVLILFTRSQTPVASGQAHPYAASLRFTDLKLSAAKNFVGGDVTYLDGQLANTGDKTVKGVSVELTFHNTIGEVVQREPLRVMALSTSGPYPDIVDLSSAPLAPGKARAIRLTLEHISADWDRAAPDIKVTSVTFQ